MSVVPRIEITVVMIAAEVTRPSDIDAIQSKLMRNVILMILLTDLMVKYDANTTLEINISNINLVSSQFTPSNSQILKPRKGLIWAPDRDSHLWTLRRGEGVL